MFLPKNSYPWTQYGWKCRWQRPHFTGAHYHGSTFTKPYHSANTCCGGRPIYNRHLRMWLPNEKTALCPDPGYGLWEFTIMPYGLNGTTNLSTRTGQSPQPLQNLCIYTTTWTTVAYVWKKIRRTLYVCWLQGTEHTNLRRCIPVATIYQIRFWITSWDPPSSWPWTFWADIGRCPWTEKIIQNSSLFRTSIGYVWNQQNAIWSY